MVTSGTAPVVDRATLFATLGRGWSVLAGLVTVSLISSRFSPELQGYYFTFASILTFQTLFELGFGTVIQQFASHEWAHLSADSHGRIRGDAVSRQRLASLARLAFRWYGTVSILVVVGLGTGGFFYFHAFSKTASAVSWPFAWWMVCLLSGALVCLAPALSLLEGCNQVSSVYGLQLVQAVTSRTVLWITIWMGSGLWTLSFAKATTFLVGSMFLFSKYGTFFGHLLSEPSRERIVWRQEIWPFQWRIAVSWAGGYLLFSFFTPVLFAFHGPVVAGQMGMTLALVGALSSICTTIVGTRVPRFAISAARGDYQELDRLFRRCLSLAVMAAGLGGLAIWSTLYLLRLWGAPLAERFLSPLETGLLLSAVVLHQIRHAMGSYLRAHKREPYLVLSIVEGVGAAVGLSLLGRWFGALGMAAGFLVLTAAVMVPALAIFERCRRTWHRPKPQLWGKPRPVDGVVS